MTDLGYDKARMRVLLFMTLSAAVLKMNAQVRLQPLFADNKVMQQNSTTLVWGMTKPEKRCWSPHRGTKRRIKRQPTAKLYSPWLCAMVGQIIPIAISITAMTCRQVRSVRTTGKGCR